MQIEEQKKLQGKEYYKIQQDEVNLEDEDTATDTIVTTTDDIGQPTITSITTYILEMVVNIDLQYSDGTSEEVDIGPANQNPPPQGPTLPILEGIL